MGVPRWQRAGMTVEVLTGAAVAEAIADVAALRIAVFRDFPYLYDGDLEYERDYLAGFETLPGSVVVVARVTGRIVGASTGLPLAGAEEAWSAPFRERRLAIEDRFYCAESVLLKPWRGMGLGHAFFDARERHAGALGMAKTCFCSVIRADDHPARPAGYRPNDAFWIARGYRPLDGITARYAWRDIGDAHESEKTLRFWERTLGDDAPGAS